MEPWSPTHPRIRIKGVTDESPASGWQDGPEQVECFQLFKETLQHCSIFSQAPVGESGGYTCLWGKKKTFKQQLFISVCCRRHAVRREMLSFRFASQEKLTRDINLDSRMKWLKADITDWSFFNMTKRVRCIHDNLINSVSTEFTLLNIQVELIQKCNFRVESFFFSTHILI